MLVSIYLFCFAIGGLFVGLSVLGGFDGAEVDAEVDVDVDAEIGLADLSDLSVGGTDFEAEGSFSAGDGNSGNGDVPLEAPDDPASRRDDEQSYYRKQSQKAWVPFFSLRFWTFGGCFFGLTGLLLTFLQPQLPQLVVAPIAIAVGVFCGGLMTWVLRQLRQRQADSMIRARDVIGLTGETIVPFDKTCRGKIEVKVKGTALDLLAFTDDAAGFTVGDRVVVVEMKENRVWVVSEDSFQRNAQQVG